MIRKGHSVTVSVRSEDDSPTHDCIFADIQELGKEKARCVVHNKECTVPDSDAFFCGVSCKDLSRQNPRRDPSKLVLSESTSPGGSAQTWAGFKSYVSTKQPGLVVFENVDAIEDQAGPKAESNSDLVLQTMHQLGYEAQSMLTDALQFGLPARRRRVYICFVKRRYCKFDFHDRPLADAMPLFRSMVSSCVRSAPCASKILLGSQDPAVSAGLAELQAKKARAVEEKAKAKAKEAKENPNSARS